MSIFGSNETDSYQVTYRISANELGGSFHNLQSETLFETKR